MLVLGAALATPVLASTEGDLERAKDQLAATQAELDRATARWQEVQTAYLLTKEQMRMTEGEIGRLEAEVAGIQAQLEQRASAAYMAGTGGALEVLFDSGSISEFSDRLTFLDSVARDDADLIAQARVKAERLDRERLRLAELAEERARQEEELERQRGLISEKLGDLQATVDRLTKKLRAERRASQQTTQVVTEALGQTPVSSGAIQVCPVAGPNSFVDSFGWPRSGGRTHQGIDLMAAEGTPVVATHAGSAVRNDNELGGISVIVTGAGGTWTYYAHLSGTATLGSVSAGTVIGYVGSTGNAGTTNHLHFELHPGGGGAVNPYSLLRAVC